MKLKGFKVPQGYIKLAETKGDLDKDNIEEIVYVYQTDIESKKGYQRRIYICKQENNKIFLWHESKGALLRSKEGGLKPNPLDTIYIKKNTLIIKQTFYWGPNSTSYTNIYRLQNSDWYLIRSELTLGRNCEYKFIYDINFSINKINISKNYEDCEEDSETKKLLPNSRKTYSYKFKIYKMDNFKPGYNEIKLINNKESVFF